jgi:hypothetical protein
MKICVEGGGLKITIEHDTKGSDNLNVETDSVDDDNTNSTNGAVGTETVKLKRLEKSGYRRGTIDWDTVCNKPVKDFVDVMVEKNTPGKEIMMELIARVNESGMYKHLTDKQKKTKAYSLLHSMGVGTREKAKE